MTTRTRNSEAARVLADIYRLAQERLGLNGALTTLHEFRSLNERNPRTGPWLIRVVRRVLKLRKISLLLARRYYNLVRAIDGGQALPNPSGKSYGEVVDLVQLLDDFGDVVDDITQGVVGSARRSETRAQRRERRDPAIETSTPAREETIRERVNLLTDALDDALEAFERKYRGILTEKVEVLQGFDWGTADPKAEESFEKQLTKDLERRIEKLRREVKLIEDDEEKSLAEQKAAIEKRARSAAYEASGSVGQSTVEPGRTEVSDLSAEDELAIGWIRVTGPNPCAFCAMLASRGVAKKSLLYNSKESALLTPRQGKNANRRARVALGKGIEIPMEKYHDNCQCEVVPVFNDAPILSERDKYFEKNWGGVTKSANGFNDKLNAWRRWLSAEYKAGRVPADEITKT